MYNLVPQNCYKHIINCFSEFAKVGLVMLNSFLTNIRYVAAYF